MPDGQRASNGAVKASTANGSAYPSGAANGIVNGTLNGSAHPNGAANGKMTLDAKPDMSEKVSRPRVVDPEWGELTLEKARAKLVSHGVAIVTSPEPIPGSTVC